MTPSRRRVTKDLFAVGLDFVFRYCHRPRAPHPARYLATFPKGEGLGCRSQAFLSWNKKNTISITSYASPHFQNELRCERIRILDSGAEVNERLRSLCAAEGGGTPLGEGGLSCAKRPPSTGRLFFQCRLFSLREKRVQTARIICR